MPLAPSTRATKRRSAASAPACCFRRKMPTSTLSKRTRRNDAYLAGDLLSRTRRTSGGAPPLRRRREVLREGRQLRDNRCRLAAQQSRPVAHAHGPGGRRLAKTWTRRLPSTSSTSASEHAQGPRSSGKVRNPQDRAFPAPLRRKERRRLRAITSPTISKRFTPTWPSSSITRPKGPILIEVFNKHEMFSGRVVALPDLHTIGACTGRMFAMVSPNGTRDGRKMAPFNWARVLRHEMVHIFNLEQTHFLVPHWLTEGLAVNNEGFPRPQPWNTLLREARAGRRADEPRQHRPRLHAAAQSGGLEHGLLPEPALCRVPEAEIRREASSASCWPPMPTASTPTAAASEGVQGR